MKKPKIVPEGFEWDSKHKELIDTRANNPKLRKLLESAIPVRIAKEYASQRKRQLREAMKILYQSIRRNRVILKELNNGSKKRRR